MSPVGHFLTTVRLCVCVCACVYACGYVKVKGQLLGVSFLPSALLSESVSFSRCRQASEHLSPLASILPWACWDFRHTRAAAGFLCSLQWLNSGGQACLASGFPHWVILPVHFSLLEVKPWLSKFHLDAVWTLLLLWYIFSYKYLSGFLTFFY